MLDYLVSYLLLESRVVFSLLSVTQLWDAWLTRKQEPELSSHVLWDALQHQLFGLLGAIHTHSLAVFGEVILPGLLLQKLFSLKTCECKESVSSLLSRLQKCWCGKLWLGKEAKPVNRGLLFIHFLFWNLKCGAFNVYKSFRLDNLASKIPPKMTRILFWMQNAYVFARFMPWHCVTKLTKPSNFKANDLDKQIFRSFVAGSSHKVHFLCVSY